MEKSQFQKTFNELTSNRFSCEPFWIFFQILQKWNQKINLISLTDPIRIVEELIVDSLQLLPYFEPNDRVLDIGSGAGFPALPIKIVYPEINLVMYEAIKKKTDFLKEAIRQLALKGVRVVNTRLEKDTDEGPFDKIVSRGTSSIKEIYTLGYGHLKVGGKFILPKGINIKEEVIGLIEESLNIQTYPYRLPISKKERQVIVIKK